MTSRIERRSWSRWARGCGTVLAYGILLPILEILEWFGLWPALISRGMRRIYSEFGEYQPSSGDVFVCSYFKSGTNWTMQIAVQVVHRGRAEFEHIHDIVPWPEIKDRGRFAVPLTDDRPRRASATGMRVIKTHLPMRKVPFSDDAKYICVVRDPKDVFVSSYHFVGSIMGPLMPSLPKWLDLFLSEDTPCGSWAEHLHGCWQLRDRPNVLFLTYEEMKADLDGTIDRIAALLRIALSADERTAVAEQATFEHMKRIGRKFDPVGIGPPWGRPEGAMVRRGQRGGSSELLAPAARSRIDDYWKGELIRLGCDFPYAASFRD